MTDPNRPYDPNRPNDPNRPYAPAPAQVPYDPASDVAATPTMDPRLSLATGRYWAGALATVLVCALIGLAAWFIVDQLAGQDLQNPPFGDNRALGWAIAGALFALVAAVLLQLLVLTTPRPTAFFGWIVV